MGGLSSSGWVPAPPHPRESERLSELHALGILDTAADPILDALTAAVRRAFDVSICLVSIVDADRQWFRSRQGIEFTETPRDVSFCAYALHEGTSLVVRDARVDPRFRDNPLVGGEGEICFYAGAVLRGPSGLPIGTFCIADDKARPDLSQRELDALVDFARVVEERLFRDPTAALLEQALFDEVSKLPRVELFVTFLSRVRQGESIRVGRVEIPELPELRDRHGQGVVDGLMAEQARRLTSLLQAESFIARADDRAFVFTIPAAWDEQLLTDKLLLIDQLLRRQVELEEVRISPDVAVGCSRLSEEPGPVLLVEAARVIELARRQGRRSALFTDSIDEEARREALMEARIRDALEGSAIELFYQPKFLAEERLVGAEALVRWTDPELGFVRPDELVALAERVGLIQELGWYVIDAACRFSIEMRRSFGRVLPVAVNVSSSQLAYPAFSGELLETLRVYGLSPEELSIEVTEGVLVQPGSRSIECLRELSDAGMCIYVDDFGTGYSSLAYLKRLPIQYLKIDRAFVQDMVEDSDSAAIVRATVDMAHALGLKVVAEGVETRDQLLVLKAYRCDEIQGYLLGKPMPGPKLLELIAERS